MKYGMLFSNSNVDVEVDKSQQFTNSRSGRGLTGSELLRQTDSEPGFEVSMEMEPEVEAYATQNGQTRVI